MGKAASEPNTLYFEDVFLRTLYVSIIHYEKGKWYTALVEFLYMEAQE
jgi:hypothetical protein